VGVQWVRWEGSDTKPAGEYTFFYGKGNENNKLGTFFWVQMSITSTAKRVVFPSDRKSYVILRVCWCHTSVLNLHVSKQTAGNGSLHEVSNDNGVRVVHFARSRNLAFKMFSHCNIINLLGCFLK
jgi:hypothetical protein